MTPAMKRVLIVAYFFPPTSAIGAKRPLGFCRYLRDFGWSPSIVTVDPASLYPPHPDDDTLAALLPPGIRVETVPHPDPRAWMLDARERLFARNGRANGGEAVRPSAAHQEAARQRSLGQAVKEYVWERIFEFPDRQKWWRSAVVRRLRQWSPAERPDVVLATGGPWTSLIVGRDLAKLFDVPFVADFRDPWTTDPDYRFESPSLTRKAHRINRRVCTAAAAVVTNTDEQRSGFLEQFPELSDRFVTITNGFQELLASAVPPPPAPERGRSDGPIELDHFGTIYSAYGGRNIMLLLRALKELLDDGTVTGARLRVRFTGEWELTGAEAEALVDALERAGIVVRVPPVPYLECVRQMAAAEALLLMQPTSDVRIPAKTYEYIASRRPIVTIGPAGAASTLVQRHELGIYCPDDIVQLKRLLGALARREIALVPPDPARAARFGYRALTRELVTVLDRVAAG